MRSDEREYTAGLSLTACMMSGGSGQVSPRATITLGFREAGHALVEGRRHPGVTDWKRDEQHPDIGIVEQRLDRDWQRIRREAGGHVERIAVVSIRRQHLAHLLQRGRIERGKLEPGFVGEIVG